jgi:glycine betaine catabolism B
MFAQVLLLKYETTIQAVIPRTSDTASYRFPRPEGLDYKPGQFFFVTLKQGGKELTKHFSFSSSPTEPGYIEFTKKFTDHEYSLALKAAKAGDWARIDAPYGKFTFEGEHPKIALLCGGIGITPFMSICKNAAEKGLSSKITLFYGCKTEADIAFRRELDEVAQKNRNLQIVYILNQASPNWMGATGIITVDLVKQQLPDYKDNIFYACGPPPMVEAMKKLLKELGLPENQLKLEYFSGYT